MEIRGTFYFGDLEFECEGDHAFDAFRAFKSTSHRVFLAQWYEQLSGISFDESDFPWRNSHYLNENTLPIFVRVVIRNTAKRYMEIHDSRCKGVELISMR